MGYYFLDTEDHYDFETVMLLYVQEVVFHFT